MHSGTGALPGLLFKEQNMTSIHRISAGAAGLCIAAVALAACGGAHSSLAGPSVLPDQTSGIPDRSSAAANSAAADVQPEKSWMVPTAATVKKLIYLSDAGRNAVVVYDYATGKQLGLLTGFHNPAGQCVDRRGDVWIADSDAHALVEYRRGALAPAQRLSTSGRPVGCSIAPNGNLAAAEDPALEDAGSAVAVWSAAARAAAYSPHAASFAVPNCDLLSPPGYDNHNNLYLECTIADLSSIRELPAGARTLRKVSFNRSIVAPGGVMWDGKYITLADRNFHFRRSTAIYRAVASASGALAVAGTTLLSDGCGGGFTNVFSPFIVGDKNTPANDRQGTTVIGDDQSCTGAFDYWAYPNESNQVKTLPSAPSYATGASVSIL